MMDPVADQKGPDNPSSKTHMGATLKWVLESTNDPARAAADWLTRDICPTYERAFDLLTDPRVTLANLVAAKEAYKTMRVVGETNADRQLAARLYAGTIAVALAHHNELITTQNRHTILRALEDLGADPEMPEILRELAGLALHVLGNEKHRER